MVASRLPKPAAGRLKAKKSGDGAATWAKTSKANPAQPAQDDRLILLYVPCPDNPTAKEISRKLIRLGLAACSNIYKTDSIYPWQGELMESSEYVCMLKTLATRAREAEASIISMHPYSVPAVLVLEPKAVNGNYLRWVAENVR